MLVHTVKPTLHPSDHILPSGLHLSSSLYMGGNITKREYIKLPLKTKLRNKRTMMVSGELSSEDQQNGNI